eukprot:gene4783-5243_t
MESSSKKSDCQAVPPIEVLQVKQQLAIMSWSWLLVMMLVSQCAYVSRSLSYKSRAVVGLQHVVSGSRLAAFASYRGEGDGRRDNFSRRGPDRDRVSGGNNGGFRRRDEERGYRGGGGGEGGGGDRPDFTSRYADKSYSRDGPPRGSSSSSSSPRPPSSDGRPPFSDRRPSDGRPPFSDRRPSNGRPPFSGRPRQSFNGPPRYRQPATDDAAGEEKTEPSYGRYDGDHLYGVNPVRAALQAKRRKMKELLVQLDMDVDNKKDGPAAQEILNMATELGLEIKHLSKHDLNMLADNRPHQGFILRAEPLDFIDLSELGEEKSPNKIVLVLDEVWDPQNFGALLRTAYFLGCDKVVACAKNSAPLSAIVSKASAGAMEVMPVYSSRNLMRFLDGAKDQGWQVVGTHLGPQSIPLAQLPLTQPTVLVLGNEGHGMRTNIVNRCSHLVRIDGAGGSESAVDSLNVSVTGGILLHHLVTATNARSN